MHTVICTILLILLFSLMAKQKSFQHESFRNWQCPRVWTKCHFHPRWHCQFYELWHTQNYIAHLEHAQQCYFKTMTDVQPQQDLTLQKPQNPAYSWSLCPSRQRFTQENELSKSITFFHLLKFLMYSSSMSTFQSETCKICMRPRELLDMLLISWVHILNKGKTQRNTVPNTEDGSLHLA